MNINNQFSKDKECVKNKQFKIGDDDDNHLNKSQKKKGVTFTDDVFSIKNKQKNIIRDSINILLFMYPTLRKLEQVYTLLFPFIEKYIQTTNTETGSSLICITNCFNTTNLNNLKQINKVIQVIIDVFINYYCRLKSLGSIIIGQKQYKYSSSHYFYNCIQSLRNIRNINNTTIEKYKILSNFNMSKHRFK